MSSNLNEFFNNIENNFSSFTEWIFSLTGIDYTIAAVTIGILISSKLDLNEQNSVGNFFFLIGQVLETINAQDIVKNSKINNPQNLTMNDLNQKIEFLYQELMNIKRNQ